MGLQMAIPDTSLVDCSDMRQKTMKVGLLARAMAVFRVECVIVYETGKLRSKAKRDSDLLVRLFEFMDTPQYLRKRIFPMTPSLKFAGLLPPLRTRSHPLESEPSELSVGMIRWGVQVRLGKLDIGVGQLVDHSEALSERTPTLLRIIETNPKIRVEPIKRHEIDRYWGFEVERITDLVERLEKSSQMTRIIFSRNASPYDRLENEIISTVSNTKSILGVFGGPKHGVSELLPDEKEAIKKNSDFRVNTILKQGTETVRLEEAVIASLALINKSVGNVVALPGFHE
ncbi:MAG: putative RNA uridine N3 methyltransferase [Candidatus Thorarchaeota archaeon]